MDTLEHWYAVWTRARHEFTVREDLRAKGMDVFLPSMEKTSVRRDRRKILTVPLFPNYIFVRAVLDRDRYIQVARTLGVVNVLGWEEKNPAWIPDEQIESVKILIDKTIPLAQHPYLQVGQWVRVLDGPLKDVVGIIQAVKGHRKLIVQIEMLKRAVACELSASDVMPINKAY
jgi:transcription termination/antitermination protein NusG